MSKVFVYNLVCESDDPTASEITVSAPFFEQHLQWLSQRREQVIELSSMVGISTKMDLYAITFDDKLRDNLAHALPLLEKYQIPMTMFPVAGFIGKENYFPESELSALAQHPLITIGSQGTTRRHFTKLSKQDAISELTESKDYLERITRKTVDLFAYPYGDCDEYAESLVAQCGYRAAWSVWHGSNSNYSKSRIPVGRDDNLIQFIAKASPTIYPVKVVQTPSSSPEYYKSNSATTGV